MDVMARGMLTQRATEFLPGIRTDLFTYSCRSAAACCIDPSGR